MNFICKIFDKIWFNSYTANIKERMLGFVNLIGEEEHGYISLFTDGESGAAAKKAFEWVK